MEIRVIIFYCLYSLINDYLITSFSASEEEANNSVFILLSLFTVVEYVLFSVAIFLMLKNKVFKRIILFASPVFFVFVGYQFYLNFHNSPIDSISITVEYLFLIAFCLFYFFEEINVPNATFIYSSYKFWLIVGILIYSTGTFFLFMNSNDLSDDEWDRWAVINYVFTILKNAFFGVAIAINKPDSGESNGPYQHFDDRFEKPITPL